MNTTTGTDAGFTLVVHIGDGKTGSSAIQRMLRTEVGSLAKAGIAYLGLMLEFAPVKKYEWQRDTRIEAFHALPRERAAEELAEILEASVRDAAGRGLAKLVWSNETLLGRNAATIDALARLKASGVDVRPVVYVRRHDAWARSGYAQWGLRHKTYEGPIKDFPQWCEMRRLALQPKLQPWLDAFGAAVSVRNFEALPDVASDFLGLLGVEHLPAVGVRANETPPAEELALRALFNHQLPGPTSPVRFNKLLGAKDIDFRLPLGDWLRSKLPTEEELARLSETYADDREAVNQALRAAGQPPLGSEPLEHERPSLNHEILLSTLFQMVVRQAQRLEKLELRLAKSTAEVATPALAADPKKPEVAAMPAQTDWEKPASPAVARVLAPGLGYFGANPSDRLTIEVGGAVKALRLSVSEPVRTFLNLSKLELLRSGAPFTPTPSEAKASQSSTAGDDAVNAAANLLAGKGIHTKGELAPWWTAEFAPPVQVDQLRLSNRSDGWGSRSRTLRVDATFEDGSTRCVYYGQSEALLRRTLEVAGEISGVDLPAILPTSSEALAGLRRQLLAGLADRIRMKLVALPDIPWPAIAPLLDVWGRADEPSKDEWTVIAGFLLSQQAGKAGTSVKSFSLLLNTHQRLERLQQELNDLGHALGIGGFMLTRHGVKREGMLRQEPARFLRHMMAVIESLMRMGRDPALAYGTLLGAVRDRNFIAHDDDVDLLYRSNRSSRPEVEAELLEIKQQLRANGFRVVDLLPNSLNMHVISPENGAVMDIFPCWLEDGKLQMHMEGMKVRGIDPDIVFPTGSIDFLGEQVPIPARPDSYLEERYGPGWREPDQFFEWPWPLKEGE